MKEALPDLEQATDEDLMLAYQGGHEEAFQVLYQRHHKKVYGYLSGKLKTPQLVDEAFQMAFMRFHQAREQYDPTFPVLPWLFTLTRSAMIDLLRSQRRIRLQEELDPITVENAIAPPIPELPAIPSLEVLAPQYRQAVEWRYFEELPFEEIANRLETTPMNARQIVSRAVRNLKRWLNGPSGGGL